MSVDSVDKAALKAELIERLEAERDTLAAAQKATSEGVTHEDAKAESDKDTRATEASYLARGQAKRVEALTADADRVRAMKLRTFGEDTAITLSALIRIADDDGNDKGTLFVAPAGGGTSLVHAVRVITPQSPLGRALIGARAGDFVTVDRAGRSEEIEVLEVR